MKSYTSARVRENAGLAECPTQKQPSTMVHPTGDRQISPCVVRVFSTELQTGTYRKRKLVEVILRPFRVSQSDKQQRRPIHTVRGHFSLTEIRGAKFPGRQTAATSLCALLQATTLCPSSWSAEVIDRLLLQGDNLHSTRIRHLAGPENGILKPEQLPTNFNSGRTDFTIRFKKAPTGLLLADEVKIVTTQQSFQTQSHCLQKELRRWLTDGHRGVLMTANDITFVMSSASNHYYLFHPCFVSCALLPRLFEFHTGFLTWPEAAKVCRSRGGVLATIHDIGTIPELQFDKEPVSNVKFWTGLSADESGTWSWQDGSPMGWSNWAPSGPGSGGCGTASLVYRYYWVKEECSYLFPFVCEYQTGTCNYTMLPKSSIIGHNNRMVFDKTPEECKKICSEMSDFICRSFEFHTRLRYCQLSSGNRWTLEGYLDVNDPSHNLYHRSCNKAFLPSSSPSPSPTPLETSFYSYEEPSTFFITPTQCFKLMVAEVIEKVEELGKYNFFFTAIWDFSTSKLIICTEYDPNNFFSSSIYPTSTSMGMLVTTTLAPVQKAIVQLEKTLQVVKENARRKTKVSTPDERPSATTVGYVAGIIMFGVLGLVIVLDLGSLFRDLKILKRNLRARRHRHKPTKVVLTFDKQGYNRDMKGQKESDIYIENKETEFVEPMEKNSEPEPDYDLPTSEVFSSPRVPRMLSQPSLGERAYSFSGSRSTENHYEDPSSVLSLASSRGVNSPAMKGDFNDIGAENDKNVNSED
ncbi:uncharacterized protein LOC135467112 [Liolophura sinensis]|uniref:uncharacterized protein LOC135467112 n=1 Tax=Liolophura sinensis TaxID=3198878 RepID=UPI003158B175